MNITSRELPLQRTDADLILFFQRLIQAVASKVVSLRDLSQI